MSNVPYYLNAMGLVCALGEGKDSISQIVFSDNETQESLGRFLTYDEIILQGDGGCYLGRASTALPDIPPDFECYYSRNNQLLLSALIQIEKEVRVAIELYGGDRVAVILGTSTSGIAEGEAALAHIKKTDEFPHGYHFGVQEMADGAEFLATMLGLSNMATTVSTACSSSAKVFSHAAELMDAGLCDVAIVGGADSLCQLTVNGFNSLGALSPDRCNPFSNNRMGISIGEGAALFLMTNEAAPIRMVSVGESSDSYSMTAPDPEGIGAENAMRDALNKAGIEASNVSYLNLHGTGTHHNDVMESKSVTRVFGPDIKCSSTKSLVGHTLGAAGAIEVALCWLMLSSEYNPSHKLLPHIWDGNYDKDIKLKGFVSIADALPCVDEKPLYALSNSFAFGGNNAAVLLKQEVGYE